MANMFHMVFVLNQILSINQYFLQGCKATAGLKVMSNCLPTTDANTSKAVIPLPQNSSSGTLTSAQICPTKPSGLRMPSPSLRYFSQVNIITIVVSGTPSKMCV